MFRIDWKEKKIIRKTAYLNRKHFFIVALLILLSPFVYHIPLFIKGKIAEGRMIGTFQENRTCIYKFKYNNQYYRATGPIDVPFDPLEKKLILFNKKQPNKNMMLHPAAFYVNYRGLLLLLLFCLWIMIYFLKRNPLRKYQPVIIILFLLNTSSCSPPIPSPDKSFLEKNKLLNPLTFSELNRHFQILTNAYCERDHKLFHKKSEDLLYITDAFKDKQQIKFINEICYVFTTQPNSPKKQLFDSLFQHFKQLGKIHQPYYQTPTFSFSENTKCNYSVHYQK